MQLPQPSENLTREELTQRVKQFFNKKIKGRYLYDEYFAFHYLPDDPKRILTKDKFYFYLMRCACDHRVYLGRERGNRVSRKEGDPNEVYALINFLEDTTKYGTAKTKKTNKEWLASKLMDPSPKGTGELWGSGEHEWLLRSLITEVLKRSAGFYPQIQSHVEEHCTQPLFDWLMLQSELRTKTKYLFFENDTHSIESGHIGAVKLDPQKRGFVTEGTYSFHEKLVEAFNASTTMNGFLTRVINVIKTRMISGITPLSPSSTTKYLVDATKTDDERRLERFRREKLYPEGYVATRNSIWNIKSIATHFETGSAEGSEEELESESEDEDELPELSKGMYRMWK